MKNYVTFWKFIFSKCFSFYWCFLLLLLQILISAVKNKNQLVLPYAGSKGKKLIKSIKTSLKCVEPENVTIGVTHLGTTLISTFTETKDKTIKKHQHDIMLNVQKVSAQKTILEKRHEGCQKEYLTVMVEMLNPIC